MGGDDEVAFVFAVCAVEDDDEFPAFCLVGVMLAGDYGGRGKYDVRGGDVPNDFMVSSIVSKDFGSVFAFETPLAPFCTPFVTPFCP